MFRADGYSELLHGFQLALEVSGLRPSTIKHYTTSKQVVASSNLVSRSNLFHVVLVSLRPLGLQ